MRKSKGFTLVETLVSLALLGVLMLMIQAVVSVMANSSHKVDEYVTGNNDASYILYSFKKDLLNARSVSVSDNALTMHNADADTVYEIASKALRRNSRQLAVVINGTFKYENDTLIVNITLADRSIISVEYPYGGVLNAA